MMELPITMHMAIGTNGFPCQQRIFICASSAQNAKLRGLTKAEISALLNDVFGGFTEERQWPKAKSMLSARY
jgi:hypothetical protein